MQRYILPMLLLVFFGHNQLQAQQSSNPLSLATQLVSGARDTIYIYYINNTSSTLQIGAMNVSLAYNAADGDFLDIPYNIFRDEWGPSNPFDFTEIQTTDNDYDGQSYDRRWQYGNTSANFFSPTSVDLTLANGQPTLAMKVVFERAGSNPPTFYLELATENPRNQQSDPTTALIEWDKTTLAAGSFPVEWLQFDATYAGNETVALTWTTATENQNRAFQIERSENGRDYVYLGEIEGAGNSVEAQDYNFLDRRATASHYYYRLRQVDFDGGFSYSEVREVLIDGSLNGSLIMFPNPAQEHVRLQGLQANQPFSIELVDMTGRMVQKMEAASGQAGIIDLDLNEVARGIYTIQLTGMVNGSFDSRKLSLN